MVKKPPFKQVLSALLDRSAVFPANYLYRFSDLSKDEQQALRGIWEQIESSRRRALLEDLDELADNDTLQDFESVARIGLEDADPGVRAQAIQMFWDIAELDLVPYLLKTVMRDPAVEVRAAAASGLGHFVYQGELEEIPEKTHHEIEDALLAVYSGSDETIVRRRALEALGFSSRSEVPALIREAYKAADPDWVVSALYAMGRSYDQSWDSLVRREMRSPNASIQLEAVRAAGELSLDSTRRILLDLLEDEGSDADLRAAAIWSLSQIGGEEVRETLEKLQEEAEDDEELELLEQALDNLALTEQIQPQMDFFNIDLADKSHYTRVVNLENEAESELDEENEENLEEDDEESSQAG